MPMPTEHEIDLAIAALENQSASLTPAKAEFIRRYYRETRYNAHIRRWRIAGAIIKGGLVCIGLGVLFYVLAILWLFSASILREFVIGS